MRDRVCDAAADVPANPTHRKNPAAGKLSGIDNFVVVRPKLGAGNTSAFVLVPPAPHDRAYHLNMTTIPPDCLAPDRSDPSVAAPVRLREEPDEEEDEEEDDRKKEDDDDEDDDGYSE
jgi:hypothetical protein